MYNHIERFVLYFNVWSDYITVAWVSLSHQRAIVLLRHPSSRIRAAIEADFNYYRESERSAWYKDVPLIWTYCSTYVYIRNTSIMRVLLPWSSRAKTSKQTYSHIFTWTFEILWRRTTVASWMQSTSIGHRSFQWGASPTPLPSLSLGWLFVHLVLVILRYGHMQMGDRNYRC